jgi:hypothetical protein
MPTSEHEAYGQLFRASPEFAAQLLSGVFDVDVPEFTDARLGSEDFSEWRPTEYRGDVTIVLTAPDPVLAVVVEVQRSPDRGKRWSWPVYLTTLRARLRCPAVLLVMCPDRAVADWCGQRIPIGHPKWDLEPLVMGPDLIPVITEPAQAALHPELAVLSALAHGDERDGKAVIEALLAGLASIDPVAADRYTDVTLLGLSEVARSYLEDLMKSGTYEYQSDFARRYFGAGKAEGKAEDVVEFLTARGIALSDDVRARILACTDLDQLKQWIRRAATVKSADELFDPQHA